MVDPALTSGIIGGVIVATCWGISKVIPAVAKAIKQNGREQSGEAKYTPSRMRCVNLPEIKQALTNNQMTLKNGENMLRSLEKSAQEAIKQSGILEK